LLETLKFISPENENITNQIRYIKILTSFCKTQDKEIAKKQYQQHIINRLFHYETNIPLWFGS